MFGTGLILWGSMTDLDEGTWKNIGYVFEWQAVGIVFMELARLVNDKLVLSPRACRNVSGDLPRLFTLSLWQAPPANGRPDLRVSITTLSWCARILPRPPAPGYRSPLPCR